MSMGGSLLDDEEKIVNASYELGESKVSVKDDAGFPTENLEVFLSKANDIIFNTDHSPEMENGRIVGSFYEIEIASKKDLYENISITPKSEDGTKVKKRTYKKLLLGEYSSKKIWLYYNNIVAFADKCQIDPIDLMQVVLCHEVGHAFMDSRTDNEAQLYKTLFGFWKEESYANAFALKLLDDYRGDNAKKLKRTALVSMNKQSKPYKYGIKVFNAPDFGFTKWKDYKKKGARDLAAEHEWLVKAGAIK